MIVICACGAKLKISDEKITTAGVKIKCPKCGKPHLVKKPAEVTPVPRANAPSMPWFAASMPAAVKPLVLIAHDSKVVADMIEQVVSETGYGVVHALDGLDALKKATALKPQVMIVDVGLTGIYGFELCERLKGDPGTRDIKIILLSSVYGLTAYKRSPVTLYGADDYIEKHHIPDKLASKIQRLLSGGKIEPPQLPAAAKPGTDMPDRAEPVQATHRSAPLIRRKGMTVDAPPAEEARMPPEAPAAPVAGERKKGPVIPEFPDIMPKVPVTLDGGRKRPIAPVEATGESQTPAASVAGEREKRPVIPEFPDLMPKVTVTPDEERKQAIAPASGTLKQPASAPDTQAVPVPSAVKETPVMATAKSKEAPLQDESVKLDAAFFEHEEYEAPVMAMEKSMADPAEIEKARRFARLIVSDIALYNQEIVAEGLRNGTFFELLHDDVTEGRSLYDNRVPEAIRATKDYYQEAFDDFIAAQKKQR